MRDGNFFNRLLFKFLPKVRKRGVDYIVLFTMVQALCMLENVVFINVIIC